MTDVFAKGRAFLQPAPERVVRKPDGAFWSAEGEWADSSLFARRRVDDGDLVEATPPAQSAAPAGEPATRRPNMKES